MMSSPSSTRRITWDASVWCRHRHWEALVRQHPSALQIGNPRKGRPMATSLSFSEANEMVTLPRTTCWCPSYDGETSDDTLDLEDLMRHCFVLLGDQVCLKELEPLLYFLLGVFLVFSGCECILRQSFAWWSIPWWSIPLEPLANLLIKVVRSRREYQMLKVFCYALTLRIAPLALQAAPPPS